MAIETVIRQYVKWVLRRKLRSIWLEDDGLKIYVRRSLRPIGKDYKMVEVIDVANVESSTPGRFREFMLFVISNNPYEGIYIENVISDRMRDICEKNYVRDTKTNDTLPSYYIRTE